MTREITVRLLDALTEACRRTQTADLLPHQHGAPLRLTLLINHDDLVAGLGVGVTEDGTEIPASAVRRLCCDADVVPVVLGSRSEVLDVGRRSRLVTPAIWRALVARDRHCRFPGCRRPPLMCHAHHVQHWVDGGLTSLDNLLLLCGHPTAWCMPGPGRPSWIPSESQSSSHRTASPVTASSPHGLLRVSETRTRPCGREVRLPGVGTDG